MFHPLSTPRGILEAIAYDMGYGVRQVSGMSTRQLRRFIEHEADNDRTPMDYLDGDCVDGYQG